MNPGLRLIITLGLLSGLVAASIDMYLPAMPAIAQALDSATGDVQQTLSMFLLGSAISQMIYGPLSDRYGRRPVLLAGLIIFTLASLLCTQVESVEQLIVLRSLQAIGASAGGVIVLALIRDLYQREDAARMMSFVMTVMTSIPLLAPIIGGYILIWYGWAAIFWVLGLFGLVSLALVFLLIKETLPLTQRQSLHPVSLFRAHWLIVRHGRAMGYNLCGGFVFAAMFAFISGSPFVYIEHFEVKAQHYGYLFAGNIVLMMICASMNPRWITRYGSQRVLMTGVLIHVLAVICLLINSYSGMGGLPGVVVPAMVSVGVLGIIAANASSAALACFPDKAGTASGVLGITRMGLGALSGAAVGILHDGSVVIMPAVMLVCALLAGGALIFMARDRG